MEDEKLLFLKYEAVRQSGKYNMIMDAAQAMIEADLTKDEYFYVIHNYSDLKERYGK